MDTESQSKTDADEYVVDKIVGHDVMEGKYCTAYDGMGTARKRIPPSQKKTSGSTLLMLTGIGKLVKLVVHGNNPARTVSPRIGESK